MKGQAPGHPSSPHEGEVVMGAGLHQNCFPSATGNLLIFTISHPIMGLEPVPISELIYPYLSIWCLIGLSELIHPQRNSHFSCFISSHLSKGNSFLPMLWLPLVSSLTLYSLQTHVHSMSKSHQIYLQNRPRKTGSQETLALSSTCSTFTQLRPCTRSDLLQPQGLCTCCSLCLWCSCPRSQRVSLPHL